MKGFKLKDGSLWTIISYETVSGCEDKTESQVLISDIVSFTGVKWEKVGMTPIHYKVNFSDCFFEDFDINDDRISEVTLNVFDLI